MFCRQRQHLTQSLALFDLEANKDNICVRMYVLFRTKIESKSFRSSEIAVGKHQNGGKERKEETKEGGKEVRDEGTRCKVSTTDEAGK